MAAAQLIFSSIKSKDVLLRHARLRNKHVKKCKLRNLISAEDLNNAFFECAVDEIKILKEGAQLIGYKVLLKDSAAKIYIDFRGPFTKYPNLLGSLSTGSFFAFSGFALRPLTDEEAIENSGNTHELWFDSSKSDSVGGIIWLLSSRNDEAAATVGRGTVVNKYQYLKLNEISLPTNRSQLCNLFGVVVYFQRPTSTRGTDLKMLISLSDPTIFDPGTSIYDQSPPHNLKCLLFLKEPDMFPDITAIGDIVRFHRLKVLSTIEAGRRVVMLLKGIRDFLSARP